MKKEPHSRVKGLLVSLFNVRGWIDFDRIRAGQRYIVNQCSTYFVPGQPREVESFEAAKARLNLTDQELLARQKGLLRLSITMLVAAILLFFYMLYNLYYGFYLSVLVGIVVMLLALTLSFRYHFWYFQIRHQKLGCSFQEWFRSVILGVKDE